MADVGGEFFGDGAELLGGIVHGADELLPVVESFLGNLAGDGDEEVLFVLEMPVQDWFGNAGGLGDGGGGGGVVAVVGEEFRRDIEELLAALGGFQSAHGGIVRSD